MKFVDISGFGHSGKGVITDLLKEFHGYNVPHHNFEFNLIRIQGGIIDLKHGLIDNWSPIRSDAAIRRFRKLIQRIGPSASVGNPKTWFFSNGMNYDSMFRNQFTKLSNNFIDSLVDYKYIGEWPYQMVDESPLLQFTQRLQSRLRIQTQHFTSISITSIDSEGFLNKTREYLNRLFSLIMQPDESVAVMHNALEPYNPGIALELFNSAKSIIVQRDPRDIYASTVLTQEGHVPSYEIPRNWRLKKSLLDASNIYRYCDRQKIYYSHVKEPEDNDVLRLRYEEIVMNYDRTLKLIYSFLGENGSNHIKKLQFFNPESSRKNVGLWKKMKDQKNIRIIEELLPQYLYNN